MVSVVSGLLYWYFLSIICHHLQTNNTTDCHVIPILCLHLICYDTGLENMNFNSSWNIEIRYKVFYDFVMFGNRYNTIWLVQVPVIKEYRKTSNNVLVLAVVLFETLFGHCFLKYLPTFSHSTCTSSAILFRPCVKNLQNI